MNRSIYRSVAFPDPTGQVQSLDTHHSVGPRHPHNMLITSNLETIPESVPSPRSRPSSSRVGSIETSKQSVLGRRCYESLVPGLSAPNGASGVARQSSWGTRDRRLSTALHLPHPTTGPRGPNPTNCHLTPYPKSKRRASPRRICAFDYTPSMHFLIRMDPGISWCIPVLRS